ncbi:MAG: hypothetical protein A2Z37_03110 [Chloroflexi bacterium RBG_19FT_COMBO_62_14]|nr:MAG: hypothetical protein A2Z37_03110 [Chloroflexi bacterium RBG_19FT_COMBO_62_14]
MRITRRKLIELAHREADRRAVEEDILSAYLIGSTVRGEPLFGGTADIDLILVHKNPPASKREVIPLSEDVHLDIAHHDRATYNEPRSLRTSPWLGPALYDPLFLLDPEHFLEWAQASARSQFNRADYRQARASGLLAKARSEVGQLKIPGAAWPGAYPTAVLDGVNSLALLVGAPAAGRRLTVTLKQRTEEAGQPEIFETFLHLIGAAAPDRLDLPGWIDAWERAFRAASSGSSDPRLAPCRMRYYLSGFEALSEAGWPQAVVWTLLSTWQIALESLGAGADGARPEWEAFLHGLNLEEQAAEERTGELEAFLDGIEDRIESWSRAHGA